MTEPKRPALRPLGALQQRILALMAAKHGWWYPGCGWIWDTESQMIRVCDSLVRRGLATCGPMGSSPGRPGCNRYDLTDLGKTVAAALKATA